MTYLQRILALGSMILALGIVALLPATHIDAQQTAPSQVPWGGVFFNNPNLTSPSVPGNFPNGLSENWGTGQPIDGNGATIPVGPDNWSARFTTTVNLVGLYDFVIAADDGVRFYLDGQLQLDRFSATGSNSYVVTANLSGATLLIVEYVDYTGPAILQVSWTVSTGTPVPTFTPAPLAQGEVVQVRGLAVRSGPFLGASLVGVARPEQLYTLLARNTQEGIFTWYRLVLDEDTIGWSSGRYLNIVGDPSRLPIENTTRFDVINQTPRFDVIGQTRAVMNLRIYPSERVPRVPTQTQIPWGETVEILARTRQGGRDFWYQVRYHDRNGVDNFGWIFAPFVVILDENVAPIDAIPTY